MKKFIDKIDWSVFLFMNILSLFGALGNENNETLTQCFIMGFVFGVPVGLMFGYIAKEV